LINIAVSVLTACFVVFTTFALNRKGIKADNLSGKLEKKADITYVDDRDGEIKSDLKDYKIQQEQRHTSEMREIDRKLDLIIKLIEK